MHFIWFKNCKKSAARAGRYKAKRELQENNTNFIGYTKEDFNTVSNIKSEKKSIRQKLKEYLISHGYPEKSIVTEYKVGMFRVDLAVIDLTTNLPAQIFEIKARDEKKGRDFLKRIDQELKYSDVLYYLVFPSNNQIGIKIKSLDDIKEAGEFIPNYKIM